MRAREGLLDRPRSRQRTLTQAWDARAAADASSHEGPVGQRGAAQDQALLLRAAAPRAARVEGPARGRQPVLGGARVPGRARGPWSPQLLTAARPRDPHRRRRPCARAQVCLTEKPIFPEPARWHATVCNFLQLLAYEKTIERVERLSPTARLHPLPSSTVSLAPMKARAHRARSSLAHGYDRGRGRLVASLCSHDSGGSCSRGRGARRASSPTP